MICKIMRPQKFMWHNIIKLTKIQIASFYIY